jgi:hypothetical protein
MLIKSAIFLATFGTKLQLKPTCNFKENPTQTRDIMRMSKLPSFRLENLASRCNDVNVTNSGVCRSIACSTSMAMT